jgi:hypothetical protein
MPPPPPRKYQRHTCPPCLVPKATNIASWNNGSAMLHHCNIVDYGQGSMCCSLSEPHQSYLHMTLLLMACARHRLGDYIILQKIYWKLRKKKYRGFFILHYQCLSMMLWICSWQWSAREDNSKSTPILLFSTLLVLGWVMLAFIWHNSKE